MEKYQVSFSLYRLAAVKTAKILVKQPDIIQCLKRLVEARIDPSFNVKSCEAKELYAQIRSQIDKLSPTLPVPVIKDLFFVTTSMVANIFGWIYETEVREINEVSKNYVDYICWTHWGSVDKSETIKAMYAAEVFPKNENLTWKKLSYYCLEDCLIDAWPETPEVDWSLGTRDWCYPLEIEFVDILSFYWHRRFQNRLDDLIAKLKSIPTRIRYYVETFSINENMFIMSTLSGMCQAVEYFWALLDFKQRVRTIDFICSRHFVYAPILLERRNRNDDIDLVRFLMQQSHIYRCDYLLHMILGSGTILAKLMTWPWQDLLIPTLEKSAMHHRLIDYTPILTAIFHRVAMQKHISGAGIEYFVIFQELWEKNPHRFKPSIDYSKILEGLVRSHAVELLTYIINDKALAARRPEFLNYILTDIKRGAHGYNNVFLIKFAAQVLISGEEREWFQRQVLADMKARKHTRPMMRRYAVTDDVINFRRGNQDEEMLLMTDGTDHMHPFSPDQLTRHFSLESLEMGLIN